jgi:hypothetical protein
MYENTFQVKILNIKGDEVTLISPDGIEETVTFDEDGQWEEWVDPPYVKEVSVSADGSEYRYYMSASKMEHGDLEIDKTSEIEWESLDEIRKEEDRRSKLAIEAKKKRELEETERIKRIEQDIKKIGITRLDYEVKKQIEILNNQANHSNIPQNSNLTDYAIAKTRVWDPSERMYFNSYFKIPLSGQSFEDFESTLNMFKDLGMEEAMSGTFAGIPSNHEVIQIFKKGSDLKISAYSSSDTFTFQYLKPYIDLAPFGVNLDSLFWTIYKHDKNFRI